MHSKQGICIGAFTLILILSSLSVFAANKPQSATDVRATTNNREATTKVASKSTTSNPNTIDGSVFIP